MHHLLHYQQQLVEVVARFRLEEGKEQTVAPKAQRERRPPTRSAAPRERVVLAPPPPRVARASDKSAAANLTLDDEWKEF